MGAQRPELAVDLGLDRGLNLGLVVLQQLRRRGGGQCVLSAARSSDIWFNAMFINITVESLDQPRAAVDSSCCSKRAGR